MKKILRTLFSFRCIDFFIELLIHEFFMPEFIACFIVAIFFVFGLILAIPFILGFFLLFIIILVFVYLFGYNFVGPVLTSFIDYLLETSIITSVIEFTQCYIDILGLLIVLYILQLLYLRILTYFFLLNNKDKATIYRNVWIKIKAFIRTLFNYVIWYVLICEITLPLFYFMYTEGYINTDTYAYKYLVDMSNIVCGILYENLFFICIILFLVCCYTVFLILSDIIFLIFNLCKNFLVFIVGKKKKKKKKKKVSKRNKVNKKNKKSAYVCNTYYS